MPSYTNFGWKTLKNAATGVAAVALNTDMGDGNYPYVYGLGATDSGRIATRTRAGSAITVPAERRRSGKCTGVERAAFWNSRCPPVCVIMLTSVMPWLIPPGNRI